MNNRELRRNGEGYPDPTAYAVLCHIDEPDFVPKALVYICSPYRGDTAANIRLAREFCATAVDHGYAPIAPHLLLTQFMDDENPHQRHKAFGINKHLLHICQELWVYQPRISHGMRQEITWAHHMRKPIRFFNNDFQEVTQ